jgi:hypothetical protein
LNELPSPPEPEPGSREYGDRLAIEMCTSIEEEMVPMLETMGAHDRAQRWRLSSELIRAVAIAETPEQLDVIERMDGLIWRDQPEGRDRS